MQKWKVTRYSADGTNVRRSTFACNCLEVALNGTLTLTKDGDGVVVYAPGSWDVALRVVEKGAPENLSDKVPNP
jgi:hypothetical protein